MFAVAFVLAQASQPTAVLRFEITGFRNQRGGVLCTLFNREDGYPGEPKKALRTAQTLIDDENKAVCEFAGLPPGDYALATVHDENDNKQLDSNWLGMPKEGVGASNNAKGFMGPPTFKDSKVRYDGGRSVHVVKLAYL